jgi:hypothetical protein
MTDLQEVATALRAAFDAGPWWEALIPHLADTVDLVHYPDRLPIDGPTPAATIADRMRGDFLTAALRDGHQVADAITVEGDAIKAAQRVIGTLPDGTAVSVPLTQAFTFADGRIVRVDISADPADTAPIMQALAQAQAQSGPPAPESG